MNRVIFQKDFEGFESLQDWDRDMSESIQSDYNSDAKVLDGEFTGTLRVTIEYIPSEDER